MGVTAPVSPGGGLGSGGGSRGGLSSPLLSKWRGFFLNALGGLLGGGGGGFPPLLRWRRDMAVGGRPILVKKCIFSIVELTEFGAVRIRCGVGGPPTGRFEALLMPFDLYSVVLSLPLQNWRTGVPPHNPPPLLGAQIVRLCLPRDVFCLLFCPFF